MVSLGSVKGPGPSSYNSAEAKNATLRHFPAFTIASKEDGRKLGQYFAVTHITSTKSCAMFSPSLVQVPPQSLGTKASLVHGKSVRWDVAFTTSSFGHLQ